MKIMFFKKRKYSWKTRESTKRFFDDAAKVLHISDLSNWYRISITQLKRCGGGGMLGSFDSLGHALQFAFPEFHWDLSKFSLKGKKSSQRWLLVQMKLLLPTANILEDYFHPDLAWGNQNRPIQLDIWVDGLKLAMEYQGEQHYYNLRVFGPGASLSDINKRDEAKKQLCIKNEIVLVCIPYWWDGKAESLSSTLNLFFPDVFPKTDSPPISLTIPINFRKEKWPNMYG
jgi:hypothetical protein